MVDSRAKGARAEYEIRDILREHTGLGWERVPGSGGFNASQGLKGDIYLPPPTGVISAWTIEVKHFQDEHFQSNIFRKTNSQIEKWLEQTYREAEQMNAKPVLMFKKTRGIWLVAVDLNDAFSIIDSDIMHVNFVKGDWNVVILNLADWLSTLDREDFIK